MFRSRILPAFLTLIAAVALTPAPAAAATAAATGGVIEGTLTTAHGEPAAGARLQVTSAAGVPGYLLPTAVTDEAGHYRLDPLPAGRYRIGFYFRETESTQWAKRAARETAATWFTVADGATTVVDEALLPVGDLDVTLLDSTGEGTVAAFCVEAIGDYYLRTGCTTTGTVHLTGLRAEDYLLMVQPEGDTGVIPEWATVTADTTTTVTVQQF